jgi:uncharacterized protein (DUF1697 family)
MSRDREQAAPAPKRVALLRGVNLGGGRTVPMARLREVAAALGWQDVATHLQSGNLLFRADGPPAELAAQLSVALRAELGIAVDVVIRTGAELGALLTAHPFADGDPARTVIACCDRPVGELAARRLADLATGSERVRVADTGTDIYAAFPDGQAASKLAAGLVTAVRPATGTARNLRTIAKLVGLAED